jgi:hypothetical protein
MNLSLPEKEYESQEFKGLNLQHAQLEGKIFTACVFEKCSFREAAFAHCAFQDCTFRHCDLSMMTLKACAFKNTLFEHSQLVGVNWVDTNLAQKKLFTKPVDFVDCALNHSTFMGLNLKNVRLTQCLAVNVSFEEADLTRANCTLTDFAESRFFHTNLTETDFTAAKNYAIAASANTLRKTIFSLPEAMSLLYSLDIVLKE